MKPWICWLIGGVGFYGDGSPHGELSALASTLSHRSFGREMTHSQPNHLIWFRGSFACIDAHADDDEQANASMSSMILWYQVAWRSGVKGVLNSNRVNLPTVMVLSVLIIVSALLCNDGSSTVSAYSFPPREVPKRNDYSVNRRTALSQIALVSSTPCLLQPANAAVNILEARLQENSIDPPPYGMEATDTDIFYPSYFLGSFQAVSKTLDIQAPCGFQLFTGGKAGFDSAVQKEVIEGDVLQYKARFITQSRGDDAGSSYIAADREFNAIQIAKAAMGSYSVVDVPMATPNRFSCVLGPPDGSNLICVDIIAIARKQEPLSDNKFACSEVVRQIVSPAMRNNPNAAPVSPLSVKEIETISVYSKLGDDKIQCRQRTATYLVPSQTDPIAFKKWQLSQGRAVDVRCYDVIYTRV
jgi:hypothetical protein